MGDLVPLVFFDLDGVLVDSRPGITTCMNATLTYFGFSPVSPTLISGIIGPPLQVGFAKLLQLQGGRVSLATDCVQYFRMLYHEAAVAGTVVQPGIRDMLAMLSARAKLAVATSKPLRFAEPILVRLGIRDAFDIVAGPTPETDGESKTATLRRAIALIAREGAALNLLTTFMIGDRSHDMIAAIENDIVPLGAAWGFGSEGELREAGATLILHAPSETVPVVSQAERGR